MLIQVALVCLEHYSFIQPMWVGSLWHCKTNKLTSKYKTTIAAVESRKVWLVFGRYSTFHIANVISGQPWHCNYCCILCELIDVTICCSFTINSFTTRERHVNWEDKFHDEEMALIIKNFLTSKSCTWISSIITFRISTFCTTPHILGQFMFYSHYNGPYWGQWGIRCNIQMHVKKLQA